MSNKTELIASIEAKIEMLEKEKERKQEIEEKIRTIVNTPYSNPEENLDNYEMYQQLKSELSKIENMITELPVLQRERDELLR